jgi:hypothetical protein
MTPRSFGILIWMRIPFRTTPRRRQELRQNPVPLLQREILTPNHLVGGASP